MFSREEVSDLKKAATSRGPHSTLSYLVPTQTRRGARNCCIISELHLQVNSLLSCQPHPALLNLPLLGIPEGAARSVEATASGEGGEVNEARNLF